MSLLLDALKKTGQPRQHGAQEVPSDLGVPEVARSAGHNLFAAKAAPTRDQARVGIIPLAIICGVLLAAIGGYYLWQETSYTSPTPQARKSPAPIIQPIALLPAEIKTPSTNIGVTKSGSVSAPLAVAAKPLLRKSRRSAAEPTSGVVIERAQAVDTANQTLTAAYQAYRNGNFATAWQHYSTVLQQDARNRDALLGMAAIAQQQGQDATAAQYYGQVLTLDPRDPAAHAGMSALTSGNVASTESRLKLLLTHRPDAATLHFALGNLYAEQSRWGEAQQSYFNATNRELDNPQYTYNLAISLDHLGQSKLAAQYYQRALQLDQSGSANFDHAQTQRRVNELTAP